MHCGLASIVRNRSIRCENALRGFPRLRHIGSYSAWGGLDTRADGEGHRCPRSAMFEQSFTPPHINEMEVVRYGSLIEFNANEFRQSFTVPSLADCCSRRQPRIIVRVYGNFYRG